MNLKILAPVIVGVLLTIILLVSWLLSGKENNSDIQNTIPTLTTFPSAVEPSTKPRRFISTDALMQRLDDYFDVSPKTEVKKTQSENNTSAENSTHQLEDKIAVIQNSLKYFDPNHDNITEIDDNIIDFIEDKDIPRIDKIYALWDVAAYFGIESDKGGYILDYLEALQPIELTGEFINSFLSDIPSAIKIQLLHLMRSNLGIENIDKQTPEQLQFIGEQSELIQKLFTHQLKYGEDAEIVRETLLLYPSVVPAEEAVSVIRDLLSTGNNIISEQEIMSLSVEVAFASHETQAEFLPSLLDSLQSQDSSLNPVQQTLNEQLYTALQDKNAAQFINQDIKPRIADYVKAQEPNLSIEDTTISIEQINAYYSWVEAYASATSSNEFDKAKIITEMIINTDDPIRQASILVLAEQEVIENMQMNEYVNQVENDIIQALDNKNISEEQKKLIETALQQVRGTSDG
ncbi:MAG: hypothetical protein ABFS56_27275 [Pseudomonadota bacterium]